MPLKEILCAPTNRDRELLYTSSHKDNLFMIITIKDQWTEGEPGVTRQIDVNSYLVRLVIMLRWFINMFL